MMRLAVRMLKVVIAASFLALIFPVCILAQTEPTVVWPTYHMDSLRTGRNAKCVDITNPASLNLIWVFPRGLGTAADEDLATVDDQEPEFIVADPWSASLRSDQSWEDHFYWTWAKSRTDVDSSGRPNYQKVPVVWEFPKSLPKGRYQIMVWVPAQYQDDTDPEGKPLHTNTTQAEYTVYDNTGATTIKFDQTIGGEWRLLTNRQFDFTGTGYYRVELSNVTDDTKEAIEAGRIIVVADAIKFVPVTGLEIYASVASAQIPWQGEWEEFKDKDITGQEVTIPAGSWSGIIPAVYACSVESPLASFAGAPDTGAVYCINSVTTSLNAYNDTGKLDWQRNWALSRFLGTTIWRYPRSAEQRYMGSTVSGKVVPPNEIEGPIEGGIYASPTLARINDPNHPLVCYVAAMDRQVYALDAATGELLWKGPGVTLGEKSPSSVLHPGAQAIRPAEAFGGEYHIVPCSESDSAPDAVVWNFTEQLRKNNGGEPSEGLVYAVYVWIPPAQGETRPRARDATYTITYVGSSGSTVTAEVRLDQSSVDNQGKWVQLGSSYFNVSKVALSTKTKQVESGRTAADYVVVADACMIVPSTIGAFGYCTPVVDIDSDPNPPAPSPTPLASNVFVVSANGRALAFYAGVTNTNKIGTLKWIYPKVRTTAKVTGDADIDDPDMGEMGASPAYWNDQLFIAGLNGKIRKLTRVKSATFADLPTESWIWPSDEALETQRAGFTSTPAIDKDRNQFVIGSIYGIFYCFSTTGTGGPNNDGLLWKYPDIEEGRPSTQLPLGAFRYSTAAIADVAGMHRAWIASTDGKIYSFDLSTNAQERRLWVEFNSDGTVKAVHGTWYLEPNALAPIQASPALDGGNGSTKRCVMFVGDMREKGVLHWYDANTGASDWRFDPNNPGSNTGTVYQGWRTEGVLFSSPNLTNLKVSNQDVSYVYNGCSDGRVYAWSPHGGAWGGRWAGGDWPFEGEPDQRQQAEVALAPDTDIQFDIFPYDFWKSSHDYAERCNPKKRDASGKDRYILPDPWPPTGNWPAIISANMKQPSASLLNKTDDEINKELLKYAKERRNHVFPSPTKRTSSSSTIYLEWGEKINIILWNLPALDYLYPGGTSSVSAKRAQIRFNLVNESPGVSAGSQIRISGTVSKLQEYTVLDKTPQTAYADPNNQNPFTYYEPLLYQDGTEVKRCFAVATVDLRGSGSTPPSPGPNWKLTVEIRKLSSTARNAAVIPMTIPLARLKAGDADSMNAPVPVLTAASTTDPTLKNFMPQDLGINNPLAINTGTGKLAWSYVPNRDDPEAHFNGNGAFTPTGEFVSGPLSLDLGSVAHGTTSPVRLVGIMDRSATGLPDSSGRQNRIDQFRLATSDLWWRGGYQAIESSGGIFFPWEFRPESADYPHIYKRYQRYRKAYDDRDPSRSATELPPLVPDPNNPMSYDSARLTPDTIQVSVEVPRFQPANTVGYRAVMQAYVDSNRNGSFDSGNVIYGRPTTYQEAYREFRASLTVPPDPRIEVEEQLVDIGAVPHGFGQFLPDFTSVNPDPAVKQWFKRITIKNAGNVNLYNVRIGDPGAPLFLVQDPRAPGRAFIASPVLPGWSIRSSVEPIMPAAPWLQQMKLEPFITRDPANPADPSRFGYTISKPRVGDPDPSVMSIPDRRKWSMDYRYSGSGPTPLYTQEAAREAYRTALIGAGMNPALADNLTEPFPTEVCVTVPVGQPVGTYLAPFVPVYAQFGRPGENKFVAASPTFGLKVTVKETQLTGDTFPAALPQIDSGPLPRYGDATPAAFRDLQTGNVYLFWSSNRVYDDAIRAALANARPDDPKLQEFASAPWFINRALLAWDSNTNSWVPAGPQMWGVPAPNENPILPFFTATGKQWPPLIGSATGRVVMDWSFGGKNTGLQSVRHYSPFIAENEDVPPDVQSGRTWLVWAGTANVVDPDGKISHEHRIFYTDATHGDVTATERKVYSIEHDPGSEKRYPSLSVFDRGGNRHRMWCFWQGSDSGRWSIYYSINDEAPEFPNTVSDPINGVQRDAWTPDARLRTPDCLTSVSSPNPVHRQFWVDLRPDNPVTSGAKHLFDVVFAGVDRLTQNSDIMLARYAAVGPNDGNRSAQPSSRAQPLPRVFGEKLKRDPKYGFFTSEHLAWIRLDPKRVAQGLESPPVLDNWGGYDVNSSNPDLPYIRVYFPNGYEVDSQTVLPPGSFVSGTDGTVRDASGAFLYRPPAPLRLDSAATENDFRLEIDQATGIYTYKYPKGSLTQRILGDMLVDFSAGIVRFTNPLKEIKNPDGTVTAPEVRADYTPQTWRLTTDMSVDNSPRAFIERTPMNPASNPGMCRWETSTGDPKPAPVDRLWVLWRRADPGTNSSTIFWKTYRVGIDLSRYLDSNGKPLPPIPMNADGTVSASANLQVSNNLGPFEVDRSGSRIYFTQVDERYRSLFRMGSTSFFTSPPPPAGVWDAGTGLTVPIVVSYKDANGVVHTVNAYDVFWLNELPEQSLFGFVGSASVNEGSVYAFADLYTAEKVPTVSGTTGPRQYSKIWVFWTTTRGGTTDLCWANLTPNFGAR